mmetsp:Transcript_6445/g.19536  ORF Transcript_6445/g.19536 Transcript_6445/m.19536 type:complete len:225 (-) Transcript_6445:463-1137(-)
MASRRNASCASMQTNLRNCIMSRSACCDFSLASTLNTIDSLLFAYSKMSSLSSQKGSIDDTPKTNSTTFSSGLSGNTRPYSIRNCALLSAGLDRERLASALRSLSAARATLDSAPKSPPRAVRTEQFPSGDGGMLSTTGTNTGPRLDPRSKLLEKTMPCAQAYLSYVTTSRMFSSRDLTTSPYSSLMFSVICSSFSVTEVPSIAESSSLDQNIGKSSSVGNDFT